MEELVVDMKNQYSTFNITPQHLGQVIRAIEIKLTNILKSIYIRLLGAKV